MHTGSSTALFPQGGYKGDGEEDNHISPNNKQMEIRKIWARLMGEVASARKGKRLIIVNLGDAIDGFHHGSLQESIFKTKDQVEAHCLLMREFMKRVAFKKGDELYYVMGTEIHVGETERQIGEELGAVKSDNGTHVHDILSIDVNGKVHVFAHHGKRRGGGQNEGNTLRNFLRDYRDDLEKDAIPCPDVLWSGHTHGHTWNTHIRRVRGGEFHELHGIICPSFQAKTRYVYGKVPFAVNSVGGTWVKIGVDGEMSRPHFVVQVTSDK